MTVALLVAVSPVEPVATIVKVVVAFTVNVVEPLAATATPLIEALAALVVCQETRAVDAFCRLAVIVAVGAVTGGVATTLTVALLVAVSPVEPVATIVKVVVAFTGTVVEPLAATATPLSVALAALYVAPRVRVSCALV